MSLKGCLVTSFISYSLENNKKLVCNTNTSFCDSGEITNHSEMSSIEFTSSESEPEESLEGGYDYEFFSDPPSHEYICLICTLVAKEAQQASCCGKIFCKECLEKSMRANDNCPHCREDLNGRYFRDMRAIRSINHLKVYCENKKGGCKWKGELCHVESYQVSCRYRHVECPNECTQAVRSMDLPWHLENQCPNREVECDHCKQVGKHAYISLDHLEDCPDVQIRFPNEGCQEKPKKKAHGSSSPAMSKAVSTLSLAVSMSV